MVRRRLRHVHTILFRKHGRSSRLAKVFQDSARRVTPRIQRRDPGRAEVTEIAGNHRHPMDISRRSDVSIPLGSRVRHVQMRGPPGYVNVNRQDSTGEALHHAGFHPLAQHRSLLGISPLPQGHPELDLQDGNDTDVKIPRRAAASPIEHARIDPSWLLSQLADHVGVQQVTHRPPAVALCSVGRARTRCRRQTAAIRRCCAGRSGLRSRKPRAGRMQLGHGR